MNKWYVLTYNSSSFNKIIQHINKLGVTTYSPKFIEIKKRSDCNSYRVVNKNLFPGYLFVYLDPEIIHTTAISTINGTKGFIKFGNKLAIVNESIIKALKEAIWLNSNRDIETIECRNIPVKIIEILKNITELRSVIERQAAFLSLLQNSDKLISKQSSTRIFSTLTTYS